MSVLVVHAGLDGEDCGLPRGIQRQASAHFVGVVQLQLAARLYPHCPRLFPHQSRSRRQRVSLLTFMCETVVKQSNGNA